MTLTLNECTDDNGHHIQAPSDVGNVAYQLTAQTEEFITGLGYSDSENLL